VLSTQVSTLSLHLRHVHGGRAKTDA
jgi:hypothetical protein